MPRIILENLRKDLYPAYNSAEIRTFAQVEAQKYFDNQKKELMEDFDTHPVTQEIGAGPEAANISSTLNNYGNLYTYIGFKESEVNPVIFLRDYLEKEIKLKKDGKFQSNNYIFTVDIPLKNTIENEFPYPDGYHAGSWLRGIETFIDGLNFYLFSRRGFNNSRSGLGIQSKKRPIRGATFKKADYLTGVLRRFRDKFRINGRFS